MQYTKLVQTYTKAGKEMSNPCEAPEHWNETVIQIKLGDIIQAFYAPSSSLYKETIWEIEKLKGRIKSLDYQQLAVFVTLPFAMR